VDPANTKNIAPTIWHVPMDVEWNILEKYLLLNGYNWDRTTDTATWPYNKIAKLLASKTDRETCNDSGAIGSDLSKNNRSGFLALPGGVRLKNGTFCI